MMGKTWYMVQSLKSEITTVTTGPMVNFEKTVPLIWSEGMIGAVPVFGNREDAERYANGLAPVIEVVQHEDR